MRRGPDRPGRAGITAAASAMILPSARQPDIADGPAPGVHGRGHGALVRIAPAEFEAAESGGGVRC
jgi:hypothetical protein